MLASAPVTTQEKRAPIGPREAWLRGAATVVLLFIFLVGIRGLGTGFKGLGGDVLDSFFQATSNPFMGLVIGILATTLVQSSSVSTSMIVALVAAPGSPLPVEAAVPMIMGANIGTTVTNTIVSLGHVTRPVEFQRAFAAATCHDFFNFIAVAVLLPLELLTGYLRKTASWLAGGLSGLGGGKLPNPLKTATKAVLHPIEHAIDAITPSDMAAAVVLIIVSALIIFASLLLIVRMLRRLAATRIESYLGKALGGTGILAMIIGVITTVMVQSSSITTSVMIPLAGAGIVRLRQVFPVTLGANVGTTITALIASMAAPPETAKAAITIALVHLLFNLTGTLMVYPFARVRELPLAAARRLADVAAESRLMAIFYVVVLFYLLPAAFAVANQLMG